MITGIAHTAVTVKDMDESIRFYTQVLGFKKAFSISGQFIELFYGGAEEHPWTDALVGFNHLCFQVDDINTSVQKIRDAGYPVDVEPRQGADHNWQAWVTDPNGIRIELMQIMPGSPQSRFG